jgi:hypothetical protein
MDVLCLSFQFLFRDFFRFVKLKHEFFFLHYFEFVFGDFFILKLKFEHFLFQLLFSPICIGSCLTFAGLVEQQEKEKLKSDVIEQGKIFL